MEKCKQDIQTEKGTMIDVSAYIGNWPFRPLPGSTPEEMLSKLNAEGISQALVSPIEGIFYDEPQVADERFFESIMAFPALIPVAVLNPKLPNWEKNLNICYEKYRTRAIKLYPNYHRYDLSDDDVESLLNAAGERNLPVIVQLRVQDTRAQNPLGSAPDVDISSTIKAMRSSAKTKFVIGSIRWAEAQSKAKEIMDLPNVWLDISNVEYTDGLRRLIHVYGTRQLLFATHAPFFIIKSAVLKLQEAGLSREEHDIITRNNAKTVFSVL